MADPEGESTRGKKPAEGDRGGEEGPAVGERDEEDLAEGAPDDGEGEELDLEAVEEELAAAEEFVEEHVQRALDPYRAMFPPAVLEEMADGLRCFLLTHPVASQMLAGIRPRAVRATSGEGPVMDVPRDDVSEPGKGQVS